MDLAALVAELERRIDLLQKVRALLQTEPSKRGPGRPKKVVSTSTGGNTLGKRKPGRPRSGEGKKAAASKTRVMSAEGRANIAAAQKARWAKFKR